MNRWHITNNRPSEESKGTPAPHRVSPHHYVYEGRMRVGLYLENPDVYGFSAAAVECRDPKKAIEVAETYFNQEEFTRAMENGVLASEGDLIVPFTPVEGLASHA